MTPREFYKELAVVKEDMSMTLSPGPFAVNVGPHDALAARTILWLVEQMPEATHGDIEEVLDAAKWWFVFWAAQHETKEESNNGILG